MLDWYEKVITNQITSNRCSQEEDTIINTISYLVGKMFPWWDAHVEDTFTLQLARRFSHH